MADAKGVSPSFNKLAGSNPAVPTGFENSVKKFGSGFDLGSSCVVDLFYKQEGKEKFLLVSNE